MFNGVDNIDGAANAEIFTVANVNTKADITGKMVGNIEYTAAGALLANGGLTGNVNLNNRGGTFYLGEGAKIIGSVTSTGGVAGTLVFIGDGEATGDIGTDDENKPDIIEIAGDNTKQVTLRGNVLVNDLVFVQGVDSSGKANIERGLVASKIVKTYAM